ncbi:MAG: sporulation transcriptional regulator SpoIIID [Oscillospiraceae bacterium]|nr:sporulation transcriptional regulator SpoIIID [Oscillospiraceae bacterium]
MDILFTIAVSFYNAPKFFIPNRTPADLTERLREVDHALYVQARVVLEQNKAERYLRGGEATRRKYKGMN